VSATDRPAVAPRRGRPPTVQRDRILDATYELLRDKGVARLSTKEIAERTGVAEGSIFYHFRDRAGLLVAVYLRALESLAEFRSGGLDDDDLRGSIARFVEVLEGYLARTLTVLYAAQADVELAGAVSDHMRANDIGPHHGLDLIGGYLDGLRDRGRVRADLDCRAAAYLLLSSCISRVVTAQLLPHVGTLVPREVVLDSFVRLITPVGRTGEREMRETE
jgi:AcrR family transcriptional regulator